MALGIWEIYNTVTAVPAWETLSKSDPEHNLLLASGAFSLRDTGLAGVANQVSGQLPVTGPWDLHWVPIDNVGYSSGHISLSLLDPSNAAKIGNITNTTAPISGFLQSLLFAASAAATKGGSSVGVHLVPGMRLVSLGLNAGTSCTILANFIRRPRAAA